MEKFAYYYKNKKVALIFSILDKFGYLFGNKKNTANFDLKNAKKILVVNLGGIGDVVIMQPFLKYLKTQAPSAQVEVIVDVPAKTVLENNPEVSQIHTFALPWLSHSQPRKLAAIKQYFKQIKWTRAQNYDLAFDYKGDPFISWWLKKAKIRFRSGFINGGLGFLYHQQIDFNQNHQPRHLMNFQLVPNFTNFQNIPEPAIQVTEAEIQTAKNSLAQKINPKKKTIIFHLGAGQPAKQWPLASWDQLLAQLTSFNLVVVGTKKDADLLAKLKTQGIINFLGTDLRQTFALIKIADLFIGHDTGPAHMAASVETPVVSIFSYANYPEVWAPARSQVLTFEVNCKYCQSKECEHITCLKKISVDEVFQAVKNLI